MHIGLDARRMLHPRDGIGQYASRLVHELSKLSNPDFQFSYFLNKNEKPFPLPENGKQKYVISEKPSNTSLWTQMKLPSLAKENKVDLIHCLDSTGPLFAKTPTVVTVHDIVFKKFPECLSRKGRLYHNLWVPRAIKKAAHIITDSESSQKDLMDFYSVPSEKITVIYLGVEDSFFQKPPKEKFENVKKKYNLDKKFIFFVGTHEPRKNIDVIIKAYSQLEPSLKEEYSLLIGGGKGWIDLDLHNLAKQCGVEDNVTFTGFLSDKEVRTLFFMADIFCFPSKYEGFGFPVLESMAASTPVITTNVSSLPEVGGDAVLYVPPNDESKLSEGLTKLIQDKDLYKKLSEAGPIQARKFQWSKTAEEVLQVYSKLKTQK